VSIFSKQTFSFRNKYSPDYCTFSNVLHTLQATVYGHRGRHTNTGENAVIFMKFTHLSAAQIE
jgi:hypothetical protein